MLFSRMILFVGAFLLVDLYFFQAVKTLTKKISLRKRKMIFYFYWSITVYALLLTLSYLFFSDILPKALILYSLSTLITLSLCKIIGIIFLLADDLIRAVRWVILPPLPPKWGEVAPPPFAPKSPNGGEAGISPPFGSGKNTDSVLLSEGRGARGSGISRLEFLNRIAVIATLLPFSSLLYGMFHNAFNYQVRRVKLNLKGLPKSFDGLRIVQLSDIHIGSFISDEPLKRALELVNREKADIIFFTGDLVNNLASETDEFLHLLKQIKAPLGVFSILGNHDYGHYHHWKDDTQRIENLEKLKNTERDAGWKLLINQNHIFERNGEKIAVVGVENWSSVMDFPKYGNLKKALEGAEGIPVKFLLSHDPSHWDSEVVGKQNEIAVTFSGHTHGMQMGIETGSFRWSPVQYIYRQWADLYRTGEQYLYVNRGLGFIGYMGRVGIMPEITVFNIFAG